ncbi:MAG TPA: carbohydrate kinase [Desulfurivibrio alkaliphilus]|uniref:Carbohydrate kinase n=1 Tax=Desulfurivibrio alkaliphilus TaxID=427923 RepID=A0A7C2X9H2_9BACT|nr:carbohydrate kinase [Desulfurivibrio alkaliphilus]
MMIVSVGEVVWDIFPEREVLGGAPVNVAYHLATQGLPVRVITRVGRDQLGEATLTRLEELGLPLNGVQRDERLPTGRVKVSFGLDGEPAYEIVAPAAWDNIEPAPALAAAGEKPFALVFGTLAQRDPRSRRAILALAAAARFCFYDVNLRPPFTPRELVVASLEQADLVKVNGAELSQLGVWLGLAAADATATDHATRQALAAALRERYRLAALVVTEGAEGAWVVSAAGVFVGAGTPARVVDTVGAGDAFFASLIADYSARNPDWTDSSAALPWPEILGRANRRGAYVASRAGATPPMPADL